MEDSRWEIPEINLVLSETDTPYDSVLYPGQAYEYTHPDRMATIAALYGMSPAPVSRCRVLELGCGTGGNILPMAYQYPDSDFIGIDLSRRAVEQGANTLAALGLKNIELRHCNILDVMPDWGRFDYIISHGVYSWVPAAVREKMLTICSENLAPQGVAHLSYNAHPLSHLRDLARDIMLFHTTDIADPQKRIAQGRAILGFLADASDKDSIHGNVMRNQSMRVEAMPDEVLFHDDLNEGSQAFLLHQFVADAGCHGLQYLADAQLSRSSTGRYSEQVRNVLNKILSERGFMARDQYQDFIDGHGFRRTLLCHGDIPLDHAAGATRIKDFYFAAALDFDTGEINVVDDSVAKFKTSEEGILRIRHPLSKAAFVHLGQTWPAVLSFAEVLAGAERMIAAVNPAQPQAAQEDIASLAEILHRTACGGHMWIHCHPPRLMTTISERPQASLIARKQVATEPVLTNLRHRAITFEDEISRQFLRLIDGTRDVDQLVADLSEALVKMGHQEGLPVTRAHIEDRLRVLAGMGLLIG
jgi:SAM-dependent methyltransferase